MHVRSCRRTYICMYVRTPARTYVRTYVRAWVVLTYTRMNVMFERVTPYIRMYAHTCVRTYDMYVQVYVRISSSLEKSWTHCSVKLSLAHNLIFFRHLPVRIFVPSLFRKYGHHCWILLGQFHARRWCPLNFAWSMLWETVVFAEFCLVNFMRDGGGR